MINIASDLDIVQKSGSWYSFNNERLGQGKEKVIAFLESQPEMMQDIETQIHAKLKPKAEEADKDSDSGKK